MAKLEINIGTEGNDGTGDSIRTSFDKVNKNFNELYAVFNVNGKITLSDLSDAPGAVGFTITNINPNGTQVIYNFTNTSASKPFNNGTQVIISGIVPIEYNGTFSVISSTLTSITVANTTTATVSNYGKIYTNVYTADQVLMASHDGRRITARTIQSSNNSITIGTTNNSLLDLTVTPQAIVARVSSDGEPELGAPLNANLFPIGKLPDPSSAAVALYNNTWGNIGNSGINVTTISQLPVTVNYGALNYVKGVASNITAATSTTPAIAGTYTIAAALINTSTITSTKFFGQVGDNTSSSSGTFTSLSASGTVSGNGFSTYFASPPAIGGTAANTGKFTTLIATTSLTTPSITSDTATTLVIDSGTTGALNIGTGENQKTITIGNTSGASSLLLKSGTGGIAVTGAVGITGALSATSLTTTTISSGGASTAGTITGTWTLTTGSTLSATYADLAEYYEGDNEYEPGTVVVFGGEKEVTHSMVVNDTRVAGVVTTNPAYIMNKEQSGIKVCIALTGRVPCKVIGRVKKGDLLTTSNTPGCAIKSLEPKLGSIIGKALEDKTSGEIGVIEVAIGRT